MNTVVETINRKLWYQKIIPSKNSNQLIKNRGQTYILPGIPQHVIQRGNSRQATFFSDEDYMRYLVDLKSACDQHQCEVHAYVLMTGTCIC